MPAGADRAEISRLCLEYTARLDAWVAEQLKATPQLTKTRYDGTVRALSRVFQEHPLSSFQTVKHNTRATYSSTLRLIEITVGDRLIRNLTILDVKSWYAKWREPAEPNGRERVKRAHEATTMLREILRFGAALRYADCKQLIGELANVKFEKAAAREKELTFAYVTAFIAKAIELEENQALPAGRGLYMAIGVAAQFELLVRQRDVIGEWTPNDKLHRLPEGIGRLEHKGETWSGYFTWESVPGWRWRMKTSKSKYRAPADFDLQRYSLLFPLLERVPHVDRTGAIVKGEHDLPIRRRSYGNWFRDIARAAGIPDDVWNMDSRAGGVTEAEEAGVPLDTIRDAATHSDARTTVRYIRRRSTRIASVAEARAAKRAADGESKR